MTTTLSQDAVTGASTLLAPVGAYDPRPIFTYERISKRRSGRLVADGKGGMVGEDRQHLENVEYAHTRIDPTAPIVDWRDNASGWDSAVRRDDWEAMLQAIASGQAMQLERLLQACITGRCQLHTVLGGYHADPLLIRIESALAAKESQVKSERQKLKQADIASQGRSHGGRRAYGYTADRKALVEDEAAHIRWAASQVLAGRSLRSIAAELSERGATTVAGGKWRSSNLGTYLRRPMLSGQRVTHGQITGAAEWPAVLDLGQWEAVRNLLANPDRRVSKSAPRVYLLSGIARCGVCGGPMRGRSNASAGLGPAYFCQEGPGCAYRRADLVDVQVRDAVVMRLAEVDATGALMAPADPSEQQRLQGAIAELEGLQDSLMRMRVRQEITEKQLATGTAEANAQLATLRDQLAQLEVTARRPAAVLDGLAGAGDAAARFDALPLEGRRAVISLLCAVTIHPQGKGGRGYQPELVQVVWK
jgi:site-specific DNA recombinase